MILNIRGTSGAGKSHIVYRLMDACGATEQLSLGDTGKHAGYALFGGQLAVVGRYETACGGCDTIKTQDEICARVREFALYYPHVLFEGLLVSQIYQRYADLAKEFNTTDSGAIQRKGAAHVPPRRQMYKWLQLDTPLDVCIQRVRDRRAKAGNTAPLDPDNSLTPKWHSCQTNFLKAQRDGLDPIWLDHKNPLKQIGALLSLKLPV